MSLTALLWLCILAGLAACALFRSIYGLSLYMFTFFLFPAFWWWGRPLPNLRWNLFAGMVFLAAVVLQAGRSPLAHRLPARFETRVVNVLIALVANATLVHVLLAPNWAISADNYIRLLKFAALFFVIVATIRNPRDLRLAMWSIVLGAAYIGYEVTINDRGNMVRGRLEGVGAAGVDDANQLASLMATVVPLAGGLFFYGNRWAKLCIVVCGPLILNVVLLCNSRGAFLALIAGALTYLAVSTGAARRRALLGLGLAGIATVVLLGDPDILSRFSTTFTSAEERDGSAASRLIYWDAGLRMLTDHPLGAGGDGYKRAYASQYLAGAGIDAGARSVHNGVLNEACEWGLQGWLLRMLFMFFAVQAARAAMRNQLRLGAPSEAALGCSLVASIATFVVSCMFGDYMDDEWGYWVPALMIAYSRLYGGALVVESPPGRVPALQSARAATLGNPAVAHRT